MNQTDTGQQLETRRAGILHKLAPSARFRRGTLKQVYQKCGKPNCCCMQQPDHPGHGPAGCCTVMSKVASSTAAFQSRPWHRRVQQMHDYQRLQAAGWVS